MEHYVITIGCEYGAKGNTIGKKIADNLGIRFYDREVIDEIIAEVGIPQEIMDKVESGITIAGKGVKGEERGSFSKYSDLTERAIKVQKQIIKKLAAKESCVIIGRCADYILKDTENVLRLFIYSPDSIRLKTVMESHSLSESDARLLIKEKDRRYHTRYKAITGTYRGDRHNRNLLIDSNLLGVDGTADYIETLVHKLWRD